MSDGIVDLAFQNGTDDQARFTPYGPICFTPTQIATIQAWADGGQLR